VHHVEICTEAHYKDGTTDVSDWQEEFDYDAISDYEYAHFKPTSSNWKSWEYRIKGTIQESDEEYEDAKELDYIIIWARAYKDANETKWNQDLVKVTMKETSGGGYVGEVTGGEAGGGGSSSALALLAVVIVVVIVVILVVVMLSKKKGTGGSVE